MRSRLRDRLKVIIGVAIVVASLLMLNLLLAPAGQGPQDAGLPTGSSYSAAADGAKLIYELLTELDFSVERNRHPLTKEFMDEGNIDVIWHARGSVPLENAEIIWTDQWISEGGTLILIDNPESAGGPSAEPFGLVYPDALLDHWLENLGLISQVREITSLAENTPLGAIPHRMPVGAPIAWPLGESREVHTYLRRGIVSPQVYRFYSTESPQVEPRPVIRDGYGIVLAKAQYGRGTVWIVSDPFLFSNLVVQEADNAFVGVNIVADSRGGDQSSVLFDEYHLGFVQSRTLVDAARTPFGKGILYLGAVVALALGTAGARFGPVRKPPGAIGVSQRAFVTALAGLWQGANALNAAADALWRRYGQRQSVRRRGLDSTLDRLRKGKPKIDELMDVAKKLDS